jgi:hypothetical protein
MMEIIDYVMDEIGAFLVLVLMAPFDVSTQVVDAVNEFISTVGLIDPAIRQAQAERLLFEWGCDPALAERINPDEIESMAACGTIERMTTRPDS